MYRPPAFVVLSVLLLASLMSTRARATTALSVDLSTPLGPVTHAASGSLYGLLEKQPADIAALVAPLHPNMFNNPAADVQQPIGDAIVVAGRVASIGARVTIRLADWFPGWPYNFTSMTDWFDKLGQTVSRRQAGNLTNIYAYEIWNEPNGTWKSSNPLSFNEFWRQTYVKLRALDPTIKITGPSLSYYDQNSLQGFLSFCKTNDCLPDIVGWHELSGGNVTSNIQSYRNLEKQLGIGPLPITINEYSGGADLSVEGQPGASAPLIAKFERFRVDSACISFWDVGHPGRLGSLLATNTDPNGGWWFYKWYGDMAGTMVTTTPPNAASATALDGFANLDATGHSASVLFGGVNDGTVSITVKGLQAAPFFGATVHVVVERTPFVNRTTVVKATTMVSATDVAVANGQLTVSVSGANNTDGYRVVLTPVGGTGAGGGADGSGMAGMPGAGGHGGAGGRVGGTGGAVATGGHAGSAGISGGSSGGNSGGTGPGTTGGGPGTGGAAASGGHGSDGTGGMSPAPGEASSAGCSCRAGDAGAGEAGAGALAERLAGLLLLLGSVVLVSRRRPA